MKDKVKFNYKMYRMACIFMWLLVMAGFVVAMFLPLEYAESIGFAVGVTMVYGTLIFSGIGFIYEMKSWFKKVKEQKE